MSRIADMLAEFHGHPNMVGTAGNEPELRYAITEEEGNELLDALDNEGREQIARELADVVYVAFGTAWVYGIDLDAALDEIHRAAMSKVEANVRRPDGKVLKPPGFVPPDMTAAVAGR